MSDKTAYLRLSLKEAKALLKWFMFQEHAHREDGEPSTITPEEVKLLNKVRSCIRKISEEPHKYAAMRLSPSYCRIIYQWYNNLLDCYIDDIDADIHAALGMFLVEFEKEKEKKEEE